MSSQTAFFERAANQPEMGLPPPPLCRCCKAFEPYLEGGRYVASLGFSVRAEPAHRNQGNHPMFSTVGSKSFFQSRTRQGRQLEHQKSFIPLNMCIQNVDDMLGMHFDIF